MDKITDVKRAHGIATITWTGGETYRLPSQVYLDFRVRPGDPIDRQGYITMTTEHMYPYALDRAAKMLSLRDMSEGEISRKLKFAGYPEPIIARVMAALLQHNFVSDERFAGQFVTRRSAKYGKMRLHQDLKRKGIDEQTAKNALETIDEDDEVRVAAAQAKKLLARGKGEERDIRRKAIAALMRRGFSYSVARKALEWDGDDEFDDP